jgi:hypothetical protein
MPAGFAVFERKNLSKPGELIKLAYQRTRITPIRIPGNHGLSTITNLENSLPGRSRKERRFAADTRAIRPDEKTAAIDSQARFFNFLMSFFTYKRGRFIFRE